MYNLRRIYLRDNSTMKGLNLSTIQNSCKLITYFVYDGYKEGVNIK